MRIPEKTILGVAGVMASLSAIRSLIYTLDGRVFAHVGEKAAQMASPEGYRIGFMIGAGLMLLVKLFAAAGLLAMLVKRFRAPRENA